MKKFFALYGLVAAGFITLISLNHFSAVEPITYTSSSANSNDPLVIAHRGGAGLSPENTMEAFEKAHSIGADVIELDVHMSKDGHLVVIHDQTVNRTTNGKGRVDQLTLRELKNLDAGYRFKDEQGKFIYRGKGVQIPALKEVLQAYTDMHFIVDIKSYAPKKGRASLEKKLWKLIKKYKMEAQVVVFSFQEDILRRFNVYAKGKIAIAASKKETNRLVTYHKLFLDPLFRPSTDVILMPVKRGRNRITNKRFIKNLHQLNLSVHYWTVNDKKQMKALLMRGADGIITDRPDVLIQLIREKQKPR